jgi:hypothetical protein
VSVCVHVCDGESVRHNDKYGKSVRVRVYVSVCMSQCVCFSMLCSFRMCSL